MKTVEEVLNELKKIDSTLPGDKNRDIRNCLKIDLFFEVPDTIFYEAMKKNNTNVDDFRDIQYARYRERKENMRLENYNLAYSLKNKANEIVGLFYDSKEDKCNYECFEMGNKESIEKYLESCDGVAISYVPSKECRYWILTSDVNDSFLMFRQNDDGSYTDIDNSKIDLQNGKYYMDN